MDTQTEILQHHRHWVIETAVLTVRFNRRLAFFWWHRRFLRVTRFLARIVVGLFAAVFGRYELVQQIAPGQTQPVRPSHHQLEADENFRRGISG